MKSECKRQTILLMAAIFLSTVAGSHAHAEEKRVAPLEAGVPSKITLQFQGVDIMEVLKLLTEQAGFNIVAGRNVSGRVTLFLKEVDPWEAFEVILAANELAYEQEGQIITVMSQRDYELLHGQPYKDRRILKSIVPQYAKAADLVRALAQVKSNIGRVIADDITNTVILMDTPAMVEAMLKLVGEMDQPLETRIFQFNYGTVKAFTPLLQEVITKGMGKISADERTNQVAVTDYPARLVEIEKMVHAFDERITEVVIDAKIVQIALSNKFQLGINWDELVRENIRIKSLGALNLTSGGSLRLSEASVSQAGDYDALIESLRTYGDTHLVSEPRLTVVNNQEAKILVGSKEPYVTTQISQAGTGTAVTAEQVNFIDVGVKLFVTPTITREGFVAMKIRPEVSSRTGTLTTSQRNEIPIVETTQAETVLLVEDGGMVILGGLIKNENTINRARIPVLGDLPWIGALFGSTQNTKKRSELVVFLTPHIISGSRKDSGPLERKASSAFLNDEGYEEMVSQRVQAIARTQEFSEPGKVLLEFILTPDGQVEKFPKVVKAPSKILAQLAPEAVMAASPFPPFPQTLDKNPKKFRIPVTYE